MERETGVGVVAGRGVGLRRRRASLPEGWPTEGALVWADVKDIKGGREFSESESELLRKGSKGLAVEGLLWTED